jgi:hypothetical protein
VTRAILRILGVAIVLAALGTVAPLRGDEPTSIKITIHPMAAPTPALKYRLLYPFTDQIAGNAAVYYGKITAEEDAFFNNRGLWDKIEDVWQEMPLDKLKQEKEIKISGWPIYFLEQGAKCKDCDWQLPIGRMPFYSILLPEAQHSRRYARMLAVKARREIAEGKYQDAIETFRINYALARNVAKGETLVNGLIGIAMCGIMRPQVTEFIQQRDAPNLYFALTQLPSPMIDMRAAVEVESNGVELSFPELRDPENVQRTPEEWRAILHRFVDQAVLWTANSDQPAKPKRSPQQLDELCEKLFPIQKQKLIDRGMSSLKVEAMSVHQVALLHNLRVYHQSFDDAAKCYHLPYPQAEGEIASAKYRTEHPKDEDLEIVPVATQIIEALRATRGAIARHEREFAVLRVIEALRIYAASHVGQLPKDLADIKEVPIPDDPVTCKAFVFRRDRDKAFLEGPPLSGVPLRYEITMARLK